MRAAWLVSLIAVLLALAGCAKQKTPAPALPPAPVAPARQAPKARVPAPASVQPPAAPVPAPPARTPVTMESRTDPVVDRVPVEARIRGVQTMLTQLNSRNLKDSARDDRDRVASMLDAARKALGNGDIRQANDVSVRAETLARTLLNAR